LGTALTAGSHPSATATKRKGKGGLCWAGVCEVGPTGPVRAREKKKKALGLLASGLKEEKGREREKVCLFFFKFLSNSFFKHSNSNQMKTMHSNHDAQTLIVSKLF
jgi:hypothetical protein